MPFSQYQAQSYMTSTSHPPMQQYLQAREYLFPCINFTACVCFHALILLLVCAAENVFQYKFCSAVVLASARIFYYVGINPSES